MKYPKTFFRFLRLLGTSLPLFLFAMIIHMVGDNFLYLTQSYFVSRLIGMAQDNSLDGLPHLLLGCILANLCALLVFFVFGALYDIYAKRGNAIVQKMMIDKLFRLPMEYFDRHHSGELVSRLMNDADTASQIFTSRLRRVTTPLMSVIVYLIPMVILCAPLALCMLLINVLSLLVNNHYLPKMKQLAKDTSAVKNQLTQKFMDIINGRDYLKIYKGAEILLEKYRKANQKNAAITAKYRNTVATLNGFQTFFDLVFALGFLLVSVFFVEKGICTIGEVAGIYTLYGTFSYHFLELGRYLPELINCIARAEIVFDFMEEPQEADAGTHPFTAGNIELCNLSFAYEEKSVLHNLTTTFREQTSTAVTGSTGCGKSTLIKLLQRLYPVADRQIFIGGTDINSMNLESLRDNIAYVPQEAYLFCDTIKENIRLGRPDADEEEIFTAARLANAHDFIQKLPDGYDTVLSAGGRNLSGGERQRIALARAFLKNAPLLLMDEATSALDNNNETEIQDSLRRLITGRTALIVAHRDITIHFCDEQFRLS